MLHLSVSQMNGNRTPSNRTPNIQRSIQILSAQLGKQRNATHGTAFKSTLTVTARQLSHSIVCTVPTSLCCRLFRNGYCELESRIFN